ncbi:MAG: hypothetical protein ABI625_25425 [bacterium]
MLSRSALAVNDAVILSERSDSVVVQSERRDSVVVHSERRDSVVILSERSESKDLHPFVILSERSESKDLHLLSPLRPSAPLRASAVKLSMLDAANDSRHAHRLRGNGPPRVVTMTHSSARRASLGR